MRYINILTVILYTKIQKKFSITLFFFPEKLMKIVYMYFGVEHLLRVAMTYFCRQIYALG